MTSIEDLDRVYSETTAHFGNGIDILVANAQWEQVIGVSCSHQERGYATPTNPEIWQNRPDVPRKF